MNELAAKIYAALFRLYYRKLPLTFETLEVTMDLKPENVSVHRWWAMLRQSERRHNLED